MTKVFVVAGVLAVMMTSHEVLAGQRVLAGHEGVRKNCFGNHLNEAIELNQSRQQRYSNLTEGGSIGITKQLIWFERFSKPIAFWIDYKAKEYQEKGVSIVCDDFVSISETPPFSPNYPDGAPKREDYIEPDFRSIKNRIDDQLDRQNLSGLVVELEKWQRTFSKEKRLNCMLTHVLDSMLRIADLAPKHEAKARALGLESPSDLSWSLLGAHARGLALAIFLDHRALEIQLKGVPILCNDVPPISRVP